MILFFHCSNSIVVKSDRRRLKSEGVTVSSVTKFTYETVRFCRRVADFADFVRHVVAALRILGDQLEPAGVEDVLVLDVVLLLDRHRFHRADRVEEIGERHEDRLVGVSGLL